MRFFYDLLFGKGHSAIMAVLRSQLIRTLEGSSPVTVSVPDERTTRNNQHPTVKVSERGSIVLAAAAIFLLSDRSTPRESGNGKRAGAGAERVEGVCSQPATEWRAESAGNIDVSDPRRGGYSPKERKKERTSREGLLDPRSPILWDGMGLTHSVGLEVPNHNISQWLRGG